MAFPDALTPLPDRGQFLQLVQQAIDRQARRLDTTFAVLLVDLDGFRAVNDSMGHPAGDALLAQIGRRLSRCIRQSDALAHGATPSSGRSGNTVARMRGDEFTILLTEIREQHDAMRVADRIHAALAKPFALAPGAEVFASASIGIAFPRTGRACAEDVLQDADIAMYRAKKGGRRRSAIFDEDMHREAVHRLQFETDLRRALERRELLLDYQPIVELGTGAPVGFEALIRWRHARLGLIQPAQFIPVAEDSGTIVEIGAWVLEQSCQRLRHWQELFHMPHLYMSVNLSAKQFRQPDLICQVGTALRRTRLDPKCLCLELTESLTMDDAEHSKSLIAGLSDLGVQLAIDDFGTGYSSLAYLNQFRVEALKIDRSFVRQLTDGKGQTLVRAMLTLGRNLGLRMVAEGVESAEEVRCLQRLGCSYAQGYFFHEPLSIDAATKLLEERYLTPRSRSTTS